MQENQHLKLIYFMLLQLVSPIVIKQLEETWRTS